MWNSNHHYSLLQQGAENYEDSEQSEVSSQGTESSKEETEHLEPWSRIFDEAEKRHETQLNSLINTKKTEIRKTWLVLNSRTLFLLFTEKSWKKHS